MAIKLGAVAGGRRERNSIRTRISGLARRAGPPGLAAVAATGLLVACGSAGTGGGSGAGAAGAFLANSSGPYDEATRSCLRSR